MHCEELESSARGLSKSMALLFCVCADCDRVFGLGFELKGFLLGLGF